MGEAGAHFTTQSPTHYDNYAITLLWFSSPDVVHDANYTTLV
jgi:hypothetical protein